MIERAKHWIFQNYGVLTVCLFGALACNMVFVHVAQGIFNGFPGWHSSNMAGEKRRHPCNIAG